jgi:hypothetical protein
MTNAGHAIARGLKTTRLGFTLAVFLTLGYVLAYLGIGLAFVVNFLRYNSWAGYVYVGVLGLLALGALAGMIVGFVGRCRCLATPDEWLVARTRIRLAVLLEACGWLSGLGNFFAAWAIALRWIPLPMIAAGITAGLSVLMLVLGRVMFLRFARAVSDTLGDEPLARQAARSLVLFVTTVACGVVGFALFQASFNIPGSAPLKTTSGAVGFGLWVAAGAVGLVGLFVYDRLLGRLRVAVVETNRVPVAEGVESAE